MLTFAGIHNLRRPGSPTSAPLLHCSISETLCGPRLSVPAENRQPLSLTRTNSGSRLLLATLCGATTQCRWLCQPPAYT